MTRAQQIDRLQKQIASHLAQAQTANRLSAHHIAQASVLQPRLRNLERQERECYATDTHGGLR